MPGSALPIPGPRRSRRGPWVRSVPAGGGGAFADVRVERVVHVPAGVHDGLVQLLEDVAARRDVAQAQVARGDVERGGGAQDGRELRDAGHPLEARVGRPGGARHHHAGLQGRGDLDVDRRQALHEVPREVGVLRVVGDRDGGPGDRRQGARPVDARHGGDAVVEVGLEALEVGDVPRAREDHRDALLEERPAGRLVRRTRLGAQRPAVGGDVLQRLQRLADRGGVDGDLPILDQERRFLRGEERHDVAGVGVEPERRHVRPERRVERFGGGVELGHRLRRVGGIEAGLFEQVLVVEQR
jgi:hypothetical protein